MKSEVTKTVFAVLSMILGGALEELCPRIGEVGCPVLLAVTVFFARRESAPFGIAVALAAGAVEESLVGAAPATVIAFFVLAAVMVKELELSLAGTALVYPLYVGGTALMGLGLEGGVFGRMVVAIPMGLVTMAVIDLVMRIVRGKAGLHAD